MHKNRTSFLDFFKAIATQIIVLHHLSSYGFLSKLMMIFFPVITSFLFDKGRLAVQVFLVIGGFLAGSKVNINVNISKEIIKRYIRLVFPFIFAIFLMIFTSFIIKSKLANLNDWDWLTNFNSISQLLAHILLLQDFLNEESLSTGVWYVAIDFQLFLITMFLTYTCQKLNKKVTLIFLNLLIIISLFFIGNSYDFIAPYFFYSYGLGLCLFLIRHKKNVFYDILWFSFLFFIALIIDFRIRVLLAYIVSILLFVIVRYNFNTFIFYNKFIQYLSKISYSTFLSHFCIVMSVNFLMQPYIEMFFYNEYLVLLLFIISWLCSIILGHYFFILVEKKY